MLELIKLCLLSIEFLHLQMKKNKNKNKNWNHSNAKVILEINNTKYNWIKLIENHFYWKIEEFSYARFDIIFNIIF